MTALKEAFLQVHSRLPPELEIRNRQSDWARRRWRDPNLPCFLEGPVLRADQSLMLVDVAHGRLLQVSPSGRFREMLRYDGEPNGLAMTPEGRMLIADARHGLLEWSPNGSASPTAVASQAGGSPFVGLNDLTLDGNECYITDQGESGLTDLSGRVIVVSTSEEPRVLIAGLPSPNGIAIDPRSGDLLVAMTRDNAVWRSRLDEDGTAKRVGRYLQLSGGVGPDGIATTSTGAVIVAHLGTGNVLLFDEHGELAFRFRSPAGMLVTNLCVDERAGRVYVTESASSSVLVGDLPIGTVGFPQ